MIKKLCVLFVMMVVALGPDTFAGLGDELYLKVTAGAVVRQGEVESFKFDKASLSLTGLKRVSRFVFLEIAYQDINQDTLAWNNYGGGLVIFTREVNKRDEGFDQMFYRVTPFFRTNLDFTQDPGEKTKAGLDVGIGVVFPFIELDAVVQLDYKILRGESFWSFTVGTIIDLD